MRTFSALDHPRGFQKTILASFISTLILIPSAVLAQDQDADETVLEEVIVTGTRTSLDNAADLKRTSDTIIDAITAEDIGVFSDNNIGEALARIPGVQLERQEGDGYRISVRGLGPRFVRTTLNGRTALSSPGGSNGSGARGFSFNIIPSEVITRATVNKSFQASDIEGGIGGTVDLQTTKALDFAARQDMDFYVAGAARATYSDLSGDTVPRGSIFANYKVNDQFGFFVSAVYDVADRKELSTESQDIDIEKFDLSAGTILNGVELTEDMEDIEAAVFDGVRNYSRERDRERLTFTGGFQWQPSDNVDINFDWTHGTLDETRGEFRSWLRIEDAVDRYADKTITNMIIDTSYGNEDSMGVIMAFDFEGFDQGGSRQVLDVAHLTQTLDETYDVGGINLRWYNDNGWSIFTDIGYAQQNKITDQRRVTVGEDKKNGRFKDGFNGSFDIR
ncbi:MAG: TonB-dependent receptor plug domain-containing protein, partial [Gammaproteobacteria bacterium]|nr:TonB-dependent receptor plug domain-containing protein [Gammaproteobacteria bacterium]